MGSKVQMAWIPKSRRMAISPKCRWSEVQLTRSLDFQMARCSYRWGLSPKRPYPNGTPACMFSCWGPILHQKRFPASTFDSKITKYMACKHAKSHHLTRLGKRYFLGLTAWCSRIRKIASAIKWLFFLWILKNFSKLCLFFSFKYHGLLDVFIYSTSIFTRHLVKPDY